MTYLKLNNFKTRLSADKYEELRGKLEASLDERMKFAKGEIVTAIGFNFEMEKFSTLQGDDKANAREAKRILTLLEREFIKSRREGTDFFPLERVKVLIEKIWIWN